MLEHRKRCNTKNRKGISGRRSRLILLHPEKSVVGGACGACVAGGRRALEFLSRRLGEERLRLDPVVRAESQALA